MLNRVVHLHILTYIIASSSTPPLVFSLWQMLARTPMVTIPLLDFVVGAEVLMQALSLYVI